MNQYELVLVTKTDFPEEKFSELQEKITNIIKTDEGKLLDVSKMGKKKLAYPIKLCSKGMFHLFSYKSNGNSNKKFARNFNINENILRYQIVKLEESKKK